MKISKLVTFFLMLFTAFSYAGEYFCEPFPEQMQIVGEVSEVITANNCDAYSCTYEKKDGVCTIKIELVRFWQHEPKSYGYFDRNAPIQVISKNSCPTKEAQVSGVLCRDYDGSVYLEAD